MAPVVQVTSKAAPESGRLKDTKTGAVRPGRTWLGPMAAIGGMSGAVTGPGDGSSAGGTTLGEGVARPAAVEAVGRGLLATAAGGAACRRAPGPNRNKMTPAMSRIVAAEAIAN